MADLVKNVSAFNAGRSTTNFRVELESGDPVETS